MLTEEIVQEYVDKKWPQLWLGVGRLRSDPRVLSVYGHIGFHFALDHMEDVRHIQERLLPCMKDAKTLLEEKIQELGEENGEEKTKETENSGRVHEDGLD